MKYCQGPICHEHKTKDRIRGPKGDKHYETRKLSHEGNFCSMMCHNEWFNKFGTRAVDHFGRIHEPKRVGCDSAWYKDYTYRYGGNHQHYFINDLLGERRPITQAQYNDKELTQPS